MQPIAPSVESPMPATENASGPAVSKPNAGLFAAHLQQAMKKASGSEVKAKDTGTHCDAADDPSSKLAQATNHDQAPVTTVSLSISPALPSLEIRPKLPSPGSVAESTTQVESATKDVAPAKSGVLMDGSPAKTLAIAFPPKNAPATCVPQAEENEQLSGQFLASGTKTTDAKKSGPEEVSAEQSIGSREIGRKPEANQIAIEADPEQIGPEAVKSIKADNLEPTKAPLADAALDGKTALQKDTPLPGGHEDTAAQNPVISANNLPVPDAPLDSKIIEARGPASTRSSRVRVSDTPVSTTSAPDGKTKPRNTERVIGAPRAVASDAPAPTKDNVSPGLVESTDDKNSTRPQPQEVAIPSTHVLDTPASPSVTGAPRSGPDPAPSGRAEPTSQEVRNPSPVATESISSPSVTVSSARILEHGPLTEMRIGVRTLAFGNVEVHTTVRDNQVGLSVGSEHGDLRSWLAAEVPGLEATLRRSDLQFDGIRFLDTQTATGGDPSGGSQRQPPPSRHWAPASTVPEVNQAVAGEEGLRNTMASSGLNLLA